MSYDIWLETDTGGAEPTQVGDDWNFTSNCGPMWRAAGADLAEFHGKKAGEVSPILIKGISTLLTNRGKFRAMNPENGWGSYDTLCEALVVLARIFGQYPNATVVVSR